MQQFDLNTVLGIAIAYGFTSFVRWLAKRRFWNGVAKRAKQYLDDPSIPINDPQEATVKALSEQQSDKVRKIADSIGPSIGRTPTKRGIKSP